MVFIDTSKLQFILTPNKPVGVIQFDSPAFEVVAQNGPTAYLTVKLNMILTAPSLYAP
jgi:DNA-binding beta-propeller fold protein YncE